ncbi:MAG: hypothetical protein QNJ64_15405 [Crocosphaera sp.]|nr:hypothetical protein [Crocosphaera sp.]
MSTQANAGEIEVQTGEINIHHRQNGDTSIDTGRLEFSVPRNRSGFDYYFPNNSSGKPNFQGCRRGQIVHQSNQQISSSNRTSSNSSTFHYRCR